MSCQGGGQDYLQGLSHLAGSCVGSGKLCGEWRGPRLGGESRGQFQAALDFTPPPPPPHRLLTVCFLSGGSLASGLLLGSGWK